ncbi:VOC family protein [Aquibacillus koreensis]|uniref:VOC family protein n=1 Tax=Aquibacillus koreensis TaxID=279446 RepID=A0A9X3WIV6_9BACI|nr:VOC family protein [Aquibacillus koreensis]MCT2538234.1 VOC family protein [Aquibacillus koreensis]MDC3420822.1 VOC family protein [Aquibacillus koreensis]
MTAYKLEQFQINHIDLVISNLEKSIAFYTDILGFSLLKKSDKEADLGIKDGHVLVHLIENSNALPPSKQYTGLYHYAILLPSRGHLASFLKHMIETGYPLVGASDHLVSEAIYLQDPDDIGIEVYVDRPKESWRYQGDQIEMATIPLNVDDLMKHYQEKWTSFPSGTMIGHLHFYVNSVKKANAFYIDKLGLSSMLSFGEQVSFVSAEGYHHHLGLNTWRGTNTEPPAGDVIGLTKAHITVSDNDAEYLVEEDLLDQNNNEITDPFGVKYKVN